MNADVISKSKPTIPEPPAPASIISSPAKVSVNIDIPEKDFVYESNNGLPVPISPSLRKISSRIGLDLNRIKGSGNGGRITETDVFNYVQYLQSLVDKETSLNVSQNTEAKKPTKKFPDYAKWGDIRSEQLSSLRKKISENMEYCWTTVPHVTQQQLIDITGLMKLRKKYNPKYKKKNAKLTITVFVIKAVQKALEKHPIFNASFNTDSNELIYKTFFNMGIAVDTDAGLIVPVIKNVDKKSILEICNNLDSLAEKARKRSLSMEEMQGSGFTISNLGGLGVGSFTPIVNAPEVAILGIGMGSKELVLDDKKNISEKLMMPISLSYDHRIIDGALGARFIREIQLQLESFDELTLQGV
tara:strand:+ start:146 stop:1219 length:1074 start_codon:yes stop_codon:yes gene_type:complete